MHAARSKVIESFVKIEQASSFLLDLAKIEQNGDSLGTKLGKLQLAVPNASYSDVRCRRVQTLLNNAVDLVNIRNSIVHAPMKFVHRSAAPVEARFENPKRSPDGSYIAVVLKLAGLKFIADHANQLANDLIDPKVTKPVDPQFQSIWKMIASAEELPS